MWESEGTNNMNKHVTAKVQLLFRRPMGVVFVSMLLFGFFLMFGGESDVLELLREWPVYGVFIMPAIVGITMLLLTHDEVSKIHKRFDRIDTKLDKLDEITAVLREIAGYLKKD